MALTLAAASEEVIKDGLLAKTLAPAKGPFPPAAASVHFRFETMLVPAFRNVANARLQVWSAISLATSAMRWHVAIQLTGLPIRSWRDR